MLLQTYAIVPLVVMRPRMGFTVLIGLSLHVAQDVKVRLSITLTTLCKIHSVCYLSV